MVALMQTESWKARNILKMRNCAFDGSSSGSGKNSDVVGQQSAEGLSPALSFPRESTYGKRPTKKDHLKQAGDDISQMLSEFKNFKED